MSKKVRGQKLDLATFNAGGQTSSSALPSAPDPGRWSGDGNRRQSDARGDRSSTYRNRDDDRGRDEGWNGRSQQEGFQNDEPSEEPWRRVGPSGGGGEGFRPRESRNTQSSERSGYQRLNLAPRGNDGAPTTNAGASLRGDSGGGRGGGDKWDNLFKGSSRVDNQRRSDDRGFEGGHGRGDRSYGGDTGSGYRGRGGGSRGDARASDNDPRFAGKFGGGGFGGRRDREDFSGPLPTAPRSALPEITAPQVPVVDNAAIERTKAAEKAAKEAKAIARVEAEKKAKEEKEARAAAAAAQVAKEKDEFALAVARGADAIASNLLGRDLLQSIESSEERPTGAALLRAVFFAHGDPEKPNFSDLLSEEKYGPVLQKYVAGAKEQIKSVSVVQEYCYVKGFPKVSVGGDTKRLMEYLLTLLLAREIIDGDGLLGWADDETLSDSDGRVDAIVQATALIVAVRDAEVDEFHEDEEEDEIDALRETVG